MKSTFVAVDAGSLAICTVVPQCERFCMGFCAGRFTRVVVALRMELITPWTSFKLDPTAGLAFTFQGLYRLTVGLREAKQSPYHKGTPKASN
jgi:hypothetical protein